MSTPPQYTGIMVRDGEGNITGYIEDAWHWRINLTLTRNPEGGYRIEGTLGDTPEALRFPLLDGDKQ